MERLKYGILLVIVPILFQNGSRHKESGRVQHPRCFCEFICAGKCEWKIRDRRVKTSDVHASSNEGWVEGVASSIWTVERLGLVWDVCLCQIELRPCCLDVLEMADPG